jgi:hypothetical protein
MPYDMYIYGQEAWDNLAAQGLDIVIDPMVLRVGQFFLAGAPSETALADGRWAAIEGDLGALVAFFDLVVLRRQFPAFNYDDTFDPGPNVGDPLGELVNTAGDKVLYHVDVEHHMYREAKAAALTALQHGVDQGGVVTTGVAEEILHTTAAVQYEWSPSLETLDGYMRTADEARVARFILGQLVFAGYAQQTGAPHVLSPKRSRLATALGLGAPQADAEVEAEIYDELRRRSRSAGAGWRASELPWTPSFLPFLTQQTLSKQFKIGPDVLLERAKELRESRSVDRYRRLRKLFLSDDERQSREARDSLAAAADGVARSLGSNRTELESFRQIAVDSLPVASGALGGAAAGLMIAGPPGAAVGAVGGLIVDRVVRAAQQQLFGWYLEGLTRRSARKLLTRALHADLTLQHDLSRQLRIIWETPRRDGVMRPG